MKPKQICQETRKDGRQLRRLAPRAVTIIETAAWLYVFTLKSWSRMSWLFSQSRLETKGCCTATASEIYSASVVLLANMDCLLQCHETGLLLYEMHIPNPDRRLAGCSPKVASERIWRIFRVGDIVSHSRRASVCTVDMRYRIYVFISCQYKNVGFAWQRSTCGLQWIRRGEGNRLDTEYKLLMVCNRAGQNGFRKLGVVFIGWAEGVTKMSWSLANVSLWHAVVENYGKDKHWLSDGYAIVGAVTDSKSTWGKESDRGGVKIFIWQIEVCRSRKLGWSLEKPSRSNRRWHLE